VSRPRILVFSSLFPHAGAPNAGLFIRNRMFRVARHLPLAVVAPVPWFPGQGLIRRWRPHFRPPAPVHEVQDGIDVHHPRFASVPGALKTRDGILMALGALPRVLALRRRPGFDVIDAHFAYPDGYAAGLLGRWLGKPVTITLRGTEVRHAQSPAMRRRVCRALQRATHVFAVSGSLARLAVTLGTDPEKVTVVGNGVDLEMFRPLPRAEARARLGIPADARVLITVGGLCERKGFHRVIEHLPALRRAHPRLLYLVVGGASPEGDWRARLAAQARELQVSDCVRFLGAMPQEELRVPLSAADVFVLASSNEGWANVLLEAMACGLPVVATDVGGSAEVVCRPELGSVVPFGQPAALHGALHAALARTWDAARIIAYARDNGWDGRVQMLVERFDAIAH